MAIYPVPAWLNRPGWSEYGAPRNSNLTGAKRKHQGYDLYAPEGTPFYATGPGRVLARMVPSAGHGYGYAVTIQYDDGVTIRYAHMPSPSSLKMLSRVELGDKIGVIGHTGNAANVKWSAYYEGKVRELRHLHVEAFRKGNLIDPRAYFMSLERPEEPEANPAPKPERKEDIMDIRLVRDSRPNDNDVYAFSLKTGKELHLNGIQAEEMAKMLTNDGSRDKRMSKASRQTVRDVLAKLGHNG